MFPTRTIFTVALASSMLLAPAATFAQAVVSEFSSDPTTRHGNDPVFFVRGPGAAQFVHDPASPSRFAGDNKGSLAVTYDSLLPTTRLLTTFPGGFTQHDDFVFGAVITIRLDGFAPDPFGFHPIAFSLINSATTGDDRTGDLSDFSADTFDTVEASYFPNISPFFGGPYFSPDVFGQALGGDAFANFGFGSVNFELQPGATYLIEMEHAAAGRLLVGQVSVVQADGRAILLPNSRVQIDLSNVTGFLVDSLGISAYHDGFNVFSQSGRSLLATVDYDLLFCGKKEGGLLPAEVIKALKRFNKENSRFASGTPPVQ